jgi:hypothetical protein
MTRTNSKTKTVMIDPPRDREGIARAYPAFVDGLARLDGFTGRSTRRDPSSF